MGSPPSETLSVADLITPEQFTATLAANDYHYPNTLRALGVSVAQQPAAEQQACRRLLADLPLIFTPLAKLLINQGAGPAAIYSEGPYPYGQQLKADTLAQACRPAGKINWQPHLIEHDKSAFLPHLINEHRLYPATVIIEDKITKALQTAVTLVTGTPPASGWPAESFISDARPTIFTDALHRLKRLFPTTADYSRLTITYVPPDKAPISSWGPATTSERYPGRVATLLSFAQQLGIGISPYPQPNQHRLWQHLPGNSGLGYGIITDPRTFMLIDLDGPIFPQARLIALLAANATQLLTQSPPNHSLSLAA